jgi:hypothetical protein
MLAMAAGALGVPGVEAVAEASPAGAADGDPVKLGQSNTESDVPTITSSGSGGGIVVEVTSVSNPAADFINQDGDGMYGQSVSGTGVSGTSTNGTVAQQPWDFQVAQSSELAPLKRRLWPMPAWME